MSTRVATGTTYLVFRNSLAFQNSRQVQLSEQLSTGKRINRPSDDPGSSQILSGIKEGGRKIEQYLRNITTADRNWRQIEGDLTDISDGLTRARDLAIQANNQLLGANELESIAEEIRQIAESIVATGNKQINGEYIYSGFRTDTKPFELSGAYPSPAAGNGTFAGTSNVKRIEIDEGQQFAIQQRLDDLLVSGVGSDPAVLDTLGKLEAALRANNTDDSDPASVGAALEGLNINLERVQTRIASTGASARRLETTRSRLEDQKILNAEFKSQLSDIDVAEVAYEFQRAQIALQATIQSAGSVLGAPSLLNFLG